MVQMFHGQMQIISENILMGMVQGQLDPAVEKTGHMSGDQARQLIGFRSALVYIIPFKDDFAAVLGEALAAHEVIKNDIWAERNFAFKGDEGYAPVVVGVWDSGVDVNVFTDHLYVNAGEIADGNDTDSNGFVDDINGIAYDLQSNPTPDLLYTLGEHEKDRNDLEGRIKGFTDITASVESPEATQIREEMSDLEPDEVKAFVEGLTLYAYHSHGTHVAGIAIEGNRYARVLAVRLTFDHHMIPEPYTGESMAKFAQSCRQSIEYFKAHDVRVVNMSWGVGLREIEHNLEANGIGKDAEERGVMARKMFEVVKTALYEAIEGAQGVLFVASAGNSDNDVEFDLFAPSGFDLPNLLVVGAVDQAGEPTNFTSFGSTVAIYGNGFEVESFVPGGRKIKMSGTSMSAPNVTNLAAKLTARDPALSPAEIKALIIDGSDDMGEAGHPMLVTNPKKSMELLEEKLTTR
jgi:subtilisin family serine protease